MKYNPLIYSSLKHSLSVAPGRIYEYGGKMVAGNVVLDALEEGNDLGDEFYTRHARTILAQGKALNDSELVEEAKKIVLVLNLEKNK